LPELLDGALLHPNDYVIYRFFELERGALRLVS